MIKLHVKMRLYHFKYSCQGPWEVKGLFEAFLPRGFFPEGRPFFEEWSAVHPVFVDAQLLGAVPEGEAEELGKVKHRGGELLPLLGHEELVVVELEEARRAAQHHGVGPELPQFNQFLPREVKGVVVMAHTVETLAAARHLRHVIHGGRAE